jgi:RHS repeat-associated protein
VYDDLGRLVSVSDPLTGTVEYGYDLAGNRTQLVYPDGQVVTYTYDTDNRLVQVEDWDSELTSYEYNAVGRLVGETLPNGADTARQHDAAGRLIHLTHTAPDDSILSEYVYKLDGVGNRVQTIEMLVESGMSISTTITITYDYDPLYRLTGADYSDGEWFAYVYDGVGNRTVMTDSTGVHIYTYDPANRLTNVDGVTYTWDNRGNLLNNGVFTYTYDAAGRMVGAQSVTATLVYTYNSSGLRVAQSVDGVVTTFAWNMATVVPKMLSDGDNLYLSSAKTLGKWNGDAWVYYLPDALGSVRQVIDGTGAVISSRRWTPFGVEMGAIQAELGYTGEWQDPNVDLVYLRARWLDPFTGRFLTRDPWSGAQQHPDSFHSYLYASDVRRSLGPVRLFDRRTVAA